MSTKLNMYDHFWLAATDPIAPCGLGLAADQLPRRVEGAYLAFCDGEVALVVENYGARLRYLVPAEHSQLAKINQVLVHLATVHQRTINVSEINAEPALGNAYLTGLRTVLRVSHDHKQVTLTAS